MLYDGVHCVIGVDTIAENMARLGLTEREVLDCLGAEYGTEIVSLGDLSQARFDPVQDKLLATGQASYHIDLDVALLGQFGRNRWPRALIADPARGLDFLQAVLKKQGLFRNHFVPRIRRGN